MGINRLKQKNMSENNNINERRQYYRIDDSAVFSFSIVNENTLHRDLDENSTLSGSFEMMELFGQMNQQMKVCLGRICEHSPETASYLKNLDNKIELLAQMCLFKEQDSAPEARRQINLGAGGLAFGNDQKLKQGTLLSMNLILSTDLLCLRLKGRVLQASSQKEDNYPYRISVGFVDISDQEVDQIIRHIMRLQSEQLRAKKEQ